MLVHFEGLALGRGLWENLFMHLISFCLGIDSLKYRVYKLSLMLPGDFALWLFAQKVYADAAIEQSQSKCELKTNRDLIVE